YYRRTFVVANPLGLTHLTARLQRDDGAVGYLNGIEIFRSNMPTGSISNTTLAVTTVGAANETRFYLNPVDAGLLRIGTNLLAVEVHQSIGTSSDVAFDLALQGEQLLAQSNPYYMTDFEGATDLTEWSRTNVSVTPIGGRHFL